MTHQDTSPSALIRPGPVQIGILADDLTSATDAAMAFLAPGDPPLILRGLTEVPTARVTAVDIDSRAATAVAAAARTSQAIAILARRSILLKTIDSTLRGHIRVEIAAAFRASGRKRLVVAPAFPAAGRITQEGRQYVHGVPVDQSAYAADPVHPAQTAQIADLIEPDFGVPVLLRQPGEDPGKACVVILDATRQEHLNAHIRALGDPSQVLWVGAPGLALALAALLPKTTEAAALDVRVRRLLIVAGSANPVTHRQCDRLADAGAPIVTDLAAACHGLTAALCLAAPRARLAQPPLSRLADQAATALSRGRFDGLIATGGETMATILNHLSINRLHLSGALEPGFPVAVAQHQGRSLTLAMKAGGFGGPETLCHAITALRGGKEPDHA